MMSGSFASMPDLSPPLGLEGLRHIFAAIGVTLTPQAAGSYLGHASALAQGMVKGMSTFAGQARGEFICVFCWPFT